jgi:hypothetical protein
MNLSTMPLGLLAPLVLLCALAFVSILYIPFAVVRRTRRRRGLGDASPTSTIYLVAMVAIPLLLVFLICVGLAIAVLRGH